MSLCVPELTLFVTSKCNLSCEGCIMSNFMRENKKYEMPLIELKNFIDVTKQSEYKLNLIICGGEPLLWSHLEEGLETIKESGISNRILLFSNVMNITALNDHVMDCLDQLRISSYQCNLKNAEKLKLRYGNKVRIVERTTFYEQPCESLPNVLPCKCVNDEFLYMKGKVYACAHGASINGGLDLLPDGTSLYVDLSLKYLNDMQKIRTLQESCLCTKCSSNLLVREITKKFKKKDYQMRLI